VISAGPPHRSSSTRPRWYEEAVFYELPVKSFFDSDGDGIGDFRGLAQKLDYLQNLGVNCLWLLPFFPSPLQDDGYDVSDYRAIHPAYGTINDFREFLREAHRRGLKVAAEMVVNHTSDEHPWFQAARAAPSGSSLRDYYVWSSSPDRYKHAPLLMSQRSNWTWDETAKAFYWHRFQSQQPDLNYENPLVREEMLKVLRFWADLGIDGLCLNGAAYLTEEEGTRCEHLPQTHEVVREFCRTLRAEYPDLMLQAGVNAWPADAYEYFGDGAGCQMAPNLALATRMFLAVRQEHRRALVNILQQTDAPPQSCQWVTLLRNHDELTLGLATDEEQDYLFREYAADPTMRLHNGILRRLAPLAENNERRIELLFGLLFAFPGAPVIYYGDELGMGDNIFLGGRNAVRTPMQWSADRNAGFSPADAARLYAPPVADPIFGYPSVNVEAQLRDSSSRFHWLRRLIALRKRHPLLFRGGLTILEGDNHKVLAFLRTDNGSDNRDQPPILVVANLSGDAQPVELDLARYAGLIPVELFGRTPFSRLGTKRYPLTLAPHGFLWFELQKSAPTITRLAAVETEEVEQAPVLAWKGKVEALFKGELQTALERDVLPGFLKSQRWFGGKARKIEKIGIADWGAFPPAASHAFHLLLEVLFEGGARDLYFLPVAIAEGEQAVQLYQSQRNLVIARLENEGQDAVLYDALASEAFSQWLLTAAATAERFETQKGQVRALATQAFAEIRGPSHPPLPVRRGPATSSNSLIFFGRKLLLKLFRRLEVGINPDFEVGRFLTEQQHFPRTPPVAGAFVYEGSVRQGPITLGILQALVQNQGDGWDHAIDELKRYYNRASARMFSPDPVPPDSRPLAELMQATPPLAAMETIGSYLRNAATLGKRTAEMHLALAADATSADFAPEPIAAPDIDRLKQEIETQAERAFSALKSGFDRLPERVAKEVEPLLQRGAAALAQLTGSWTALPHATKTRVHGDYHLGQVLWVDNDYVLLDFEGEPTRSVEERREKFSPLRDVAGMLRSYHYAAYAGLFAFTQDRPEDFPRLAPWAELWQQWVSAAFLAAYVQTAQDASFLPTEPREFAFLLEGYMLAKALYELAYELNNRPDWVRIPLGGVLRLLGNHLADTPTAGELHP
jgi:maltose alpha-D-glucosyltransferase/alpha-amylase